MTKIDIPDGEIIQFSPELCSLDNDVCCLSREIEEAYISQNDTRAKQNELMVEIASLSKALGLNLESVDVSEQLFLKINEDCKSQISKQLAVGKRIPELSAIDMIVAAIAGLISIAIDVVFVGTPEVVKIWRGGEQFDGSKLTSLLRKIGDDPNSKTAEILKWLSDKCVAPYDISAEKDVVYPQNHRLRGLAHDPFLGLFFAVADIILGTTTCIDNKGKLTVLIGKHNLSTPEKILSVFFYIGHILSDICTARGIPVPGFFLTQFFTNGNTKSLAKVAEKMYLDGYDVRHLASTAAPVMVKNLIVDAYFALTNEYTDEQHHTIAESEIELQQNRIKKLEMMVISDAVASVGNFAKFTLPPNCGNPAALNLTQWGQLILNSIALIRGVSRDMSLENAVEGRKALDENWSVLMENLQ